MQRERRSVGRDDGPSELTAPGLDELVRASLRVIKEVGVDGFTMRRVGEALGTTPMAAYHYVRSRDELLELCATAVLAGSGTDPSGTTWQAQLRDRAHRTFSALSEYPGLGAFLLGRPLSPAAREGHHHGVEMLVAAGMEPLDAEIAQATYHTYMFGLLGMEARFRPLKRRRAAPVGRADQAILVAVDVDQFVDAGLDILIAGIEARLAGTSTRRATRRR